MPIFLDIITYDPSIKTMNHPGLIAFSCMGNTIGLKRVTVVQQGTVWNHVKRLREIRGFNMASLSMIRHKL